MPKKIQDLFVKDTLKKMADDEAKKREAEAAKQQVAPIEQPKTVEQEAPTVTETPKVTEIPPIPVITNKVEETQPVETVPTEIVQAVEEPQKPKEPRFENGRELSDINVIDFDNVTLRFGDFTLFNGLTFNIPDFKHEGQFISIIGRSGSGKSQCARLISGLSSPTEGEVRIYGIKVDEKTHVPMVFQQYSSFPWMKVVDNVALPMKLKRVRRKERKERAVELLKLVGLDGQEDKWARYPDLSGGQLQRVSLARNLAADSQIMILDEATSALDVFSKRDMQQALLNVYYDADYDPTIINITHDISEAVMLSNRIIILRSNPSEIYKVVDIDFDGRRTQEIRNTDKFVNYVKEIESIMDEVAKE